MKRLKVFRFLKQRSPQIELEEINRSTFDIAQRNRIRLGKLLLLAGLGLACLVVLELRQEVVKAFEVNSDLAIEALRDRVPENWQPPASSQVTTPRLQPNADSTASDRPVQPSASPQRQILAVNTDSNPTDAEAQISQVDPTQMAVNEWAGSSFPVENFQIYTSPFGYRRSPDGSYNQEFHYGLDMAAPEGSYIRNWWTGTVVEVTDNSNCGTSVVVESGHWLHIYCHMQGHVESSDGKRYMIDRAGGIQIWEGQEVTAGVRIGRVGMTGRTTGPHLHWGLKYDGNWVDPALVLRAMYAGQRAGSQSASAQVR
jgi:murein DD-endopeptidase MepM/ murein hydrolase activator NlpD